MNEDQAEQDFEYFRQIIDEKLERQEGAYLEMLAMKQHGGDFDAEGKFYYFNNIKNRGIIKCSR